MPPIFFFYVKQGKPGSSIQPTNVLKPEPIHTTFSINKFSKFGSHVCRHFTAWSCAQLWRGVWKLAPSRDFRNQRARGQKTIGSHLKSVYAKLFAQWRISLKKKNYENRSVYTLLISRSAILNIKFMTSLAESNLSSWADFITLDLHYVFSCAWYLVISLIPLAAVVEYIPIRITRWNDTIATTRA